MVDDQVAQVYSHRQEQEIKRARGALPDADDVVDPSSWPYTDADGPPWPDPQHDQRQGYSADDVTLADFTIAPREHLCPECWQIHRPEVECP